LRPISVLEHCKPERLSTIDEESAAEAARVPNNPFSSAVLANEKERRSRTRGRLDLFHAILRDSLNDGLRRPRSSTNLRPVRIVDLASSVPTLASLFGRLDEMMLGVRVRIPRYVWNVAKPRGGTGPGHC
jgi:hypothetical protein